MVLKHILQKMFDKLLRVLIAEMKEVPAEIEIETTLLKGSAEAACSSFPFEKYVVISQMICS